MPKQIWHSPCFVEFVEEPQEKRQRILLEWAEYLLHMFAAMGDKKAKQLLSELPKYDQPNYPTSRQVSGGSGDSNP